MPDQILINLPLYEPIFMGNPLYMNIIYGLIIAIVFGLLIFWKEFWEPLAPVRDFRIPAKSSDPTKTLALVHTMDRKMFMMDLDLIANMFETMKMPLKWAITSLSGYQMGKVNIVEVSDDWGVTWDLALDEAIVAAADKWNADPENKDKPIFDWSSFQTYLMNGELDTFFPDGMKLPPFRVVSMDEIRKYRPKLHAANMSGYVRAKQDQRTKKDEEKEKRLMLLMGGGAVLIIICSAIGYILLTSMKCPVCTAIIYSLLMGI